MFGPSILESSGVTNVSLNYDADLAMSHLILCVTRRKTFSAMSILSNLLV